MKELLKDQHYLSFSEKSMIYTSIDSNQQFQLAMESIVASENWFNDIQQLLDFIATTYRYLTECLPDCEKVIVALFALYEEFISPYTIQTHQANQHVEQFLHLLVESSSLDFNVPEYTNRSLVSLLYKISQHLS